MRGVDVTVTDARQETEVDTGTAVVNHDITTHIVMCCDGREDLGSHDSTQTHFHS